MFLQFKIDIDSVIRKAYSDTSKQAFEIVDVQKYEVMDGDRKRYQVMVKAKNTGDSDGVVEVRFNSANAEDEDNQWWLKVNEQAKEEAPARLSVIKQGETKLF